MNSYKWLDNTQVVALERCPRSYYWRHVAGITKQSALSHALAYGSAVHKALERAFTFLKEGSSTDAAFQEALAGFQEKWNELAPELDPTLDDWRGYQAFLEAFSQWWEPMLETLLPYPEIKLVETRLAVKIPATEWQYKCRIDLALSNGANGTMIVDHKTTSRPISMAIGAYTGSPQLRTYAWACSQVLSEGYISAAYSLCYSSRRRTQSGWSKLSCGYSLMPDAITPNILEMAGLRLVQAAQEIDERMASNNWPLRLSQCHGRYSLCEYKVLCDNIGFAEPEPKHLEFAQEAGYAYQPWDPFEL